METDTRHTHKAYCFIVNYVLSSTLCKNGNIKVFFMSQSTLWFVSVNHILLPFVLLLTLSSHNHSNN